MCSLQSFPWNNIHAFSTEVTGPLSFTAQPAGLTRHVEITSRLPVATKRTSWILMRAVAGRQSALCDVGTDASQTRPKAEHARSDCKWRRCLVIVHDVICFPFLKEGSHRRMQQASLSAMQYENSSKAPATERGGQRPRAMIGKVVISAKASLARSSVSPPAYLPRTMAEHAPSSRQI